MTKYKQEMINDYIQLNSGSKFYVMNPKVEDIQVQDIAHALSNLCRFTGHGDRFYSVGEHSILCARVARKMGLSPLQQLYALGHDASESVVNDLARPIKQHLPEYKELEGKVMEVMWEAMGLPKPTEEDYEIIKVIDNTLLVNELEQLMKRSKSDIPDVEHEKIFVNLTYGYGAGESKRDFLFVYHALMLDYLGGY